MLKILNFENRKFIYISYNYLYNHIYIEYKYKKALMYISCKNFTNQNSIIFKLESKNIY